MGIEPTLVAWEATVLPLNYTRRGVWLQSSEFASHRDDSSKALGRKGQVRLRDPVQHAESIWVFLVSPDPEWRNPAIKKAPSH
jgi:hypothetical protein